MNSRENYENYGVEVKAGKSEGKTAELLLKEQKVEAVSSIGQNLDRQILELKKYVPEENIVTDKASGKNWERLGYQALKGPLDPHRGGYPIRKIPVQGKCEESGQAANR